LIIGSTGSFGSAMSKTLRNAGRPVTTMLRPGRARHANRGLRDASKLVFGDALKEGDLRRAAAGHDEIVVGLNFPYPSWRKHWPRAIELLLKVATEQGARLVFPGNVYGQGTSAARERLRPGNVYGQGTSTARERLRPRAGLFRAACGGHAARRADEPRCAAKRDRITARRCHGAGCAAVVHPSR
jgi:hypothetical protein